MTHGKLSWKELTEKAKHLPAKRKHLEKRDSDQMHTFTGAKATRADMIFPSVILYWLDKEATPSPVGTEKELVKSCSQNCHQISCTAHGLLCYIVKGLVEGITG